MTDADRQFIDDLATYVNTVNHKGIEKSADCVPALPAQAALHDTAALASAISEFIPKLHQAYEIYASLARGDLTPSIPKDCYLAMPAKALKANLQHLTWQTQQIAEGDLQQKVQFMGEFSEAFNQLVDALKSKHALKQELIASQASLRNMNSILETQATTDMLTNLRNRQYFESQLDKEINRASRYGSPLSFVIFDIDNFKAVNDAFGHLCGDHILKTLASALRDSIRNLDILARWGGEEFVLLLPGCNTAEAVAAAEKLRHRIETQDFDIGQLITCSFGVTEYRHKDTPDTMTARADQAMYAAKQAGKNRVVISD